MWTTARRSPKPCGARCARSWASRISCPGRVAVYPFRSEREYELVHVFRTVYDGEVRPSGELDGGRFWSPDEIRENLGQGVFTPNFEGEAGLILG